MVADAELFEKEERRRTVVSNERAKLTAIGIDRLSTACIAAGFIGPVVSFSSGQIVFVFSWATVISTIAWLLNVRSLHLIARHVLGKLKP